MHIFEKERKVPMSEELVQKDLELSEKDIQLIRMIRQVGYGEIHIHISDGKPVRAEEIKKSVKF